MGGPKHGQDEVGPRSPRPVETRKRSLFDPSGGGRGMRAVEWKRGVLGPLAQPITRVEPAVPSASQSVPWPEAQPAPHWAAPNCQRSRV
jgi:hypothetical protein